MSRDATLYGFPTDRCHHPTLHRHLRVSKGSASDGPLSTVCCTCTFYDPASEKPCISDHIELFCWSYVCNLLLLCLSVFLAAFCLRSLACLAVFAPSQRYFRVAFAHLLSYRVSLLLLMLCFTSPNSNFFPLQDLLK